MKIMAILMLVPVAVLSVSLHIWTIAIAYRESGKKAAWIAALFDASEYYWYRRIGEEEGYDADYCRALRLLFLLVAIALMFCLLGMHSPR